MLYRRRPDHVLESVRPGEHVELVFGEDLRDEPVEVRSLDEVVLELLEPVGIRGGQLLPDLTERVAARREPREPVPERETGLRDEGLGRSLLARHLVRAV